MLILQEIIHKLFTYLYFCEVNFLQEQCAVKHIFAATRTVVFSKSQLCTYFFLLTMG
jgi:hypothetical protein